MAVLRVQVPLSEHPSGIVEYTGDVSACVDDATQTLFICQDSMILAEFPQGRYDGWAIVDAPPSED